jgi:5-methylcytosine-specific restriction enzyme subunit McrC
MSVWPINLVEGIPLGLAASRLSDDEALAIKHSGIADVEFPSPLNGHRYTLLALGRVGHVPVAPGKVVSVQPKAPVVSIFRLLEQVYNLKSFRFHDGTTHLDTVRELLERLAHVLARRVLHRVRLGLYREYVEETGQIQQVRGRLDVPKTCSLMSRGIAAAHCRYTEQTADIRDNRILLWTLKTLLNAGIQRESVRNDLRQAYRALSGTISEQPATVADCIGRTYHRLNQDYSLLHSLCALLLGTVGPDVRVGTTKMLPFELNMANLYERFVAAWLARQLEPALSVQAHRGIEVQASREFRLDLDIVISDPRTRRALCVVDTKYKTSPSPSRSDFNQVVVYAAAVGARHAVLAYPFALEAPFSGRLKDIEVAAMSFDLARPIEAAGEMFLSQLMSLRELSPHRAEKGDLAFG